MLNKPIYSNDVANALNDAWLSTIKSSAALQKFSDQDLYNLLRKNLDHKEAQKHVRNFRKVRSTLNQTEELVHKVMIQAGQVLE